MTIATQNALLQNPFTPPPPTIPRSMRTMNADPHFLRVESCVHVVTMHSVSSLPPPLVNYFTLMEPGNYA